MRKFLWFFVIIPALFSACEKEQVQVQEDNIFKKNGIHFREQWASPGPDFDTLMFSFREEYDKEGRMIYTEKNSIDGRLAVILTAKYNEYGDEVYRSNKNVQQNKTYEYIHEYEYKNGQKVSAKYQSPEGIFDIKFIYEEDGILIREEYKDGELFNFSKINKNGDKIEESKNKGIILSRIEYDEYGNKTVIYRKTGKSPERKIEYFNKYDDKGQQTRMVYKSRTIDYEYDDKGNRIRESWYNNGVKDRVLEYKFEYY